MLGRIVFPEELAEYRMPRYLRGCGTAFPVTGRAFHVVVYVESLTEVLLERHVAEVPGGPGALEVVQPSSVGPIIVRLTTDKTNCCGGGSVGPKLC